MVSTYICIFIVLILYISLSFGKSCERVFFRDEFRQMISKIIELHSDFIEADLAHKCI